MSRKTLEDLFWGVLPKRGHHDLWPLWRNFVGKVPKNVTGKFGKFGQKSFAPPKICMLLNLCPVHLQIFKPKLDGGETQKNRKQ